MRIAYIAAGAAGMYCGSCLHDNTLAAALLKKGHEVALIPTYTPLRTDEANVAVNDIFYGGINVYLQEKFSLFRRTPWGLDRLFNNPSLLNWVSRFSSSTNARDLGSLTVSVLAGEEGHQKKELEKLAQWLKESYQPELVQLTNSMFVGMARELKRMLGVPVLCALQGEDLFLEELIEPYKSQAKKLLRERAREIDGFIVMSQYYADFMADYLAVPAEKIHVVKLGINLRDHGSSLDSNQEKTFVVGYLARLCPEKGLHLLVEAMQHLVEKFPADAFKLKVAGYLSPKDQKYFADIQKKIQASKLREAFEYAGEVTRVEKINFLQSLHLLSVPTVYQEPKGLYVLEALANGVPVVQPHHGAFPELLQATGGGILVEPNSASALAEGILALRNDAARRQQHRQQGKAAVHRDFSDETMAEATLAVYRHYLKESKQEKGRSMIAKETALA